MAFTSVRVWDLPTRVFHWALATCVIGLVISAKLGGNAMVWHFRLGYAVLALLVFRFVWGLWGGRWSRFSSFLFSPPTLWRYLAARDRTHVHTGHSPLGALSVFAMLLVLALQVASGLTSDDEIAFAGPLARFASSVWVGRATWYHAALGQYLVYALVALHLLAIGFYVLVRRQTLVGPMVHGNKALPPAVPPSRDSTATRLLAFALLAACTVLAWWVSTLGVF